MLRDVLLKLYPYLLIPPISEVLLKKPDDGQIEKWILVLERFLNKLMNSSELRASVYVYEFLTSNNLENI